jgi:hypothetical protein
MPNLDFNASEYEVVDYTPLEPGEYPAVIVESEDKPTAKGDRYVKLKLQICEGRYQNRTLFDNLNLWNSSETARNIARGTLASICQAVGVPSPKYTEMLHNKKLIVVVALEKRADTGEIRNVIKAYRPYQTQIPNVPAVAEVAAAGEEKRKPW